MRNITKHIIFSVMPLVIGICSNNNYSTELCQSNTLKNCNGIDNYTASINNNRSTENNNINSQQNNLSNENQTNIFDKYFYDDLYQGVINFYERCINEADDSYENFIVILFNMFDTVWTKLDDTIDINWDDDVILQNQDNVSIEYVKQIAQEFDNFKCNNTSNNLITLQEYIRKNNINTVSLHQFFSYVLNRSRKLFANTMEMLCLSIIEKNNAINNLNIENSSSNNNNDAINEMNRSRASIIEDNNAINNLSIVKSSSNVLSNVLKILKTGCKQVFGNKDTLDIKHKELLVHLTLGIESAHDKVRAYFSNFDSTVPLAFRTLYHSVLNQIIILKNKITENNYKINIRFLFDTIRNVKKLYKSTSDRIQDCFKLNHAFYSNAILDAVTILESIIRPLFIEVHRKFNNQYLSVRKQINQKIETFKNKYFPTTEEDLSVDESIKRFIEVLKADVGNRTLSPEKAQKTKQDLEQAMIRIFEENKEKFCLKELPESTEKMLIEVEKFIDSRTRK